MTRPAHSSPTSGAGPASGAGRTSGTGPEAEGATQPRRGISRRAALGFGAATAATAAGAGALGWFGRGAADRQAGPRPEDQIVEFYGQHQAGITTPAQDRMCFAGLNVTTDSVDELKLLLKDWTAAAARMTRGQETTEGGFDGGSYHAPPEDTGEAFGLAPGHLTITIGFGRSLFVDAEGNDRFGLKDRLPEALVEMPHFPADVLDEQRCNGDLCIQACADDPQVAVHAVRNLIRLGFGTVSTKWMQLGFGRTSSTSQAQETPRNLFGFKDGTANIMAEEEDRLNEHVWVRDGSWMDGGSYLCARRIRMILETWDREPLGGQEAIFGRTKRDGAPLSGGGEFDAPDFNMPGSNNQPVIATDAHVRLAHPSQNGGAAMLRRGYNYADGTDAQGNIDAGLFFIAFVSDPRTGFIPIQNRLAREDSLSEYLKHTGSAIFAIPPGTGEGGYIGQTLFGS